MKPDLASPAYTPNRAERLIDLLRLEPGQRAQIRALAIALAHNRRLRPDQLESILSQMEVK